MPPDHRPPSHPCPPGRGRLPSPPTSTERPVPHLRRSLPNRPRPRRVSCQRSPTAHLSGNFASASRADAPPPAPPVDRVLAEVRRQRAEPRRATSIVRTAPRLPPSTASATTTGAVGVRLRASASGARHDSSRRAGQRRDQARSRRSSMPATRAGEFQRGVADRQRLKNKQALIGELEKSFGKIGATAPHHVLLLLDATPGQNAFNQVGACKRSRCGYS